MDISVLITVKETLDFPESPSVGHPLVRDQTIIPQIVTVYNDLSLVLTRLILTYTIFKLDTDNPHS